MCRWGCSLTNTVSLCLLFYGLVHLPKSVIGFTTVTKQSHILFFKDYNKSCPHFGIESEHRQIIKPGWANKTLCNAFQHLMDKSYMHFAFKKDIFCFCICLYFTLLYMDGHVTGSFRLLRDGLVCAQVSLACWGVMI